jgi:HEAT repeat protein
VFYSPLPRTLAAALRDLAEPKPAVRAAALRDLMAYVEGDRAAVLGGLEIAVCDTSAEVRARAAEAIGDAGLSEGLPWLITMANDESALARQYAILGLGLLKDARAEEALREGLSDERPEVRFQATMAYARVAPKEKALPAVLSRTRDEDPAIVHIALRMTEELWNEEPTDERILARARACLRHDAAPVRAVAAIIVASAGKDWGDAILLEAAEGKLGPIDNEDLAGILELIGERQLKAAEAALRARARGGFLGLSRDPCQWNARVALARLGDKREQDAILKELKASSIARRTMGASAAGRAKLASARPLLEAMLGRPDLADQDAVTEALRKLEVSS